MFKNLLTRSFDRKSLLVINPLDYDVQSSMVVGEGEDSQVFCGRYKDGLECVFKRYYDVSYSELQFYKTITEKAKEVIENKKISLKQFDLEFRLEVVPIDLIGILEGHTIEKPATCSISRYIDGPNLRDIYSLLERTDFNSFYYKRIINSSWPNIFTKENKEQVLKKLKDLSLYLNNSLGVRGIDIIPFNLKPQNVEKDYFLFITDLYARLRLIRHEKIIE